ncbi:hypothetical protein BJV82DRAFT_674326 [Fennellomyces sp. T-0311]|nr:hypothetical protein BJV82DRAFT_674326 [Fennellomyces sp. T-0311]
MHSITHDKELWDGIFAVVTEIVKQRITKDSYALQAFKILRRMCTIRKNTLMRAINQESKLTTVENTQECADGDVHDEEGETDMNWSVSNDRTTVTSSSRKIEHRIFVPSETDRYLVEGKDMSVAFYAFQMVALNNFNELEMEINVHHILALSSVLRAQNNRRHPDMIGIFTKDHLLRIFTDEQKRLKVGAFIENHFPATISASITDIVKDVKKKRDEPNAGIEKIPKQELEDEIKEFELRQRYHDPILSGLFDDPSNDVWFRWTSVTNQEAKSSQGSGAIPKQRPDSVATELDGLYFGRSLGFVEVRCAKEAGNKFAISKDPVRLGTQSKNAIDHRFYLAHTRSPSYFSKMF